MTKKDTIIKILGDNNEYKTCAEITLLFYEHCPEKIEEKRNYYISNGIFMTESKLFHQVSAEISSNILIRLYDDGIIYKIKDVSKNKYKLTDIGIEYYKTLQESDNDFIIQDIPNDLSNDLSFQIGIVYLLQSNTFNDTYKIGITSRSIEERIIELKKDVRYGLFDLKPIMFIETSNMQLLEQVLHKYFEEFRLCKKNTLLVDSELFKGYEKIQQEFEDFFNMISKSERFNARLIKF